MLRSRVSDPGGATANGQLTKAVASSGGNPVSVSLSVSVSEGYPNTSAGTSRIDQIRNKNKEEKEAEGGPLASARSSFI